MGAAVQAPDRGWMVCGCVSRVTCGMPGVPLVSTWGLPRGLLTVPKAWGDCRQRPGWAQGRPLHASFLLNALHRISLICASLWFETQKEGGRKRNITVFVTCPLQRKATVGVGCAGGRSLGLVGDALLRGCGTALLGPPLAFGDLTSAVGDVDRLCGGILVMSRPRDRHAPCWLSLMVTLSSSFSPDTQCVGQFGGRHRKNSKFLTYSISKVEKDRIVTKINNFSIVFWWPWAQWPQQGHWRGRAPAE